MVNEELIKKKIAAALSNIEQLTQKEIDALWQEATAYIRTLPEEKRGGFYWRSGLECLFMFTTESRRNHD